MGHPSALRKKPTPHHHETNQEIADGPYSNTEGSGIVVLLTAGVHGKFCFKEITMKESQITRTVYTVSDFISWQTSGSLSLSPSFQRRPVWGQGAKSYFIDTIARGLPVPIIFLRKLPSDITSHQPIREVVDGQQRLRTIIAFIDSGLLDDCNPDSDLFTVRKTHNKELAGKNFNKLPESAQQRILDYQFGVTVFSSDTDDKQVLQIFARMNSTGTTLNGQELRNAEFFGEYKTLMYSLSSEQLDRWRKWSVFTESNIARMDEVELTSELIQMMYKGVVARTKKSLDNMYKDHDSQFPNASIATRRFRHAMDVIDEGFGTAVADTFSRRPLFYCLFAAVYDTLYGIGSPLDRSKPKKFSAKLANLMSEAGTAIIQRTAPESVLEAAARRTTHASSRNAIISHLRGE